MDIKPLIPGPEIMPAHPLVFTALGILFFTLHIIMINIAFGGSLILLFKSLRSRTGVSGNFHDINLSQKIPTVMALAINFGVAPYLFLQVLYGQFFYTSSIILALFWFLIAPLLIVVYYGAYVQAHTRISRPTVSTAALTVIVILVLLIAFIFVNNMTLMLNPKSWLPYFKNSGGTVLNCGDPTLVPRYLHFIIASVAVAGLFMALADEFRVRKGAAPGRGEASPGLKIYGFATMAQFIAGIWFLLSLPDGYTGKFLGGNALYTAALAVAVTAGIISISASMRGKPVPAAACFFVTIVLMAVTRSNLRSLYLDGYYVMQDQKIVTQYGPALLFIFVFTAGAFLIRYMVMLAISSSGKEKQQ